MSFLQIELWVEKGHRVQVFARCQDQADENDAAIGVTKVEEHVVRSEK